MRTLSILLLLLVSSSCWGAITDQPGSSGAANLYDELQAVCRTLQYAGTQGNITALAKHYMSTTNNDIREAITAANGLYWVLRLQFAEADRYADHLRLNFHNSKYQFLLARESYIASCTNCRSGIADIPCLICNGTGKCRICGGRGKVAGMASGEVSLGSGNNLSFKKSGAGGGGSPSRTLGGPDTHQLTIRPLGGTDPGAQQACSVCGGSGICKSCNGTKLGKGKCSLCKGTGEGLIAGRSLQSYTDVLTQIRGLAYEAAMYERNMVLVDQRWIERGAAAKLLKERAEELADFVRATTAAEKAKDYPTAYQLLDNALARHADSTYTADVQRVKELLRADAEDKKLPEKAARGQEQLEVVNSNPRLEIASMIETLLMACRRGTNASLLVASQSKPVLPANPEKWQIGEMVLINRAARVRLRIEHSCRSGFPVSEWWEFRFIYENYRWRVWQTVLERKAYESG